MESLLRGGPPETCVWRGTDAAGRTAPARVRGIALRDGRGRVTGALLLRRDLSAEKGRQELRTLGSVLRGEIWRMESSRDGGVRLGRLCYPETLSELVTRELEQRCAEAPARQGPVLTSRECQVVDLVAGGLSSRDLAERLGLGVRTIDSHRQRIMEKLDIHSVAGLTKYAVAEELTHLERENSHDRRIR